MPYSFYVDYSLAWRRAILEKIILVHLAKKFPAFMNLNGPLLCSQYTHNCSPSLARRIQLTHL
jgi:hypothetical protein